jgi:hypothetical protein
MAIEHKGRISRTHLSTGLHQRAARECSKHHDGFLKLIQQEDLVRSSSNTFRQRTSLFVLTKIKLSAHMWNLGLKQSKKQNLPPHSQGAPIEKTVSKIRQLSAKIRQNDTLTPMSLETVCFSPYSLISIRVIAVSSSNKHSARALHSSVLPNRIK